MTPSRSDRTLAERADVRPQFVEALIELGIVPRGKDGTFTTGDVRRVRVVDGLVRGGMPLAAIGEALTSGALSLDWVDQPGYERFSAEADVTFRELSQRTGIPLDLLSVVREAMGFPQPGPEDRVRAPELRVVPLLEVLLRAEVRPALIERSLRVAGDGLRRVAETEADWWRSEILDPLLREGLTAKEVGERNERVTREWAAVSDDALLAIYHGQQGHGWMRNVFETFEDLLTRAGLLERLARPPAMCFFDVAGYSRLTEERGDAEAADVAGRVARLVQRTSAEHGGRTVKWLGDGVMLFFREPGGAVLAVLDMMDGIARDGLPPAHVGLHAGPVLFQEGDYFGRTVNGASRIADHAQRGQVLVSQEVVDATSVAGVTFDPIGPVELKGLLEPLFLHSLRRG